MWRKKLNLTSPLKIFKTRIMSFNMAPFNNISPARAYSSIKMLGIIQLLIGFVSLLIAPIEIYCFYLFSESGHLHYEGFGIGSFLHVLIVGQIFALYAIGILFIIIGYGHLKLKSWTLNLSIASIRFWILFGTPFMVFFLPLLTTKEINTGYPVLLVTSAAIILVILIPGLLLFFYKQENVKRLFMPLHVNGYAYEIMPVSSFMALLVYLLYILLFHIMIFFHGIFPLFGRFLTGLNGIIIYSFLILIFCIFIYGLYKKNFFLWIGSVVVFTLLTLSAVITFLSIKYLEIIDLLDLPKLEDDIFAGLPLKSVFLLVPLTFILGISLIIIIKTRKNYRVMR